ncbi:MAG TPA: FAD-dependent oxidoreductase [Amycolatopsis sp.]|nr:FAD-dependent oxidoreductase [Amycolatopsis sp.]
MKSVTIVGAALAGLSAARALRARSYDGRIVLVGDEPHRPYDRPPLSKGFLAGTLTPTDLELSTEDDEALDLAWRLGRRATGLDPMAREVVLDSGERIVSDAVVLATGARARRLSAGPSWPVGGAVGGVHTLRSLDDAVALRKDLRPGARLVVIGAGFIGAEVASTAHGLGLDVTVVEAQPIPMAAQLGPEMGALCARLHGDHGVRLLTKAGVLGLSGPDPGENVRAVRLDDGREIPADVVVAGIGATPCVDWLVGSGVKIDHGVLVDARCATNLPGVVAAGDCTATYQPWTGRVRPREHWTNALRQPEIAAATVLGRTAPSPPVPYFWSDQYGVRLQFAGHYRDGDRIEIVEGDTAARRFVAVYRRDGRPVAVLALNQPKLFGRWRRELAVPERCAA